MHANGNISAAKTPATGRLATVYSDVQNSRLDHSLPLPKVIKNQFDVVDGPASSAAGNPGLTRVLLYSVLVYKYVSGNYLYTKTEEVRCILVYFRVHTHFHNCKCG